MLELFKSQIICRGFESFVPQINQLHLTVIEIRRKKNQPSNCFKNFL